ncbi:MAG: hypothetical protein IKN72_07405 [Clostridia bacterium]|nr:hypothetical protein [Clostridia bacterium]
MPADSAITAPVSMLPAVSRAPFTTGAQNDCKGFLRRRSVLRRQNLRRAETATAFGDARRVFSQVYKVCFDCQTLKAQRLPADFFKHLTKNFSAGLCTPADSAITAPVFMLPAVSRAPFTTEAQNFYKGFLRRRSVLRRQHLRRAETATAFGDARRVFSQVYKVCFDCQALKAQRLPASAFCTPAATFAPRWNDNCIRRRPPFFQPRIQIPAVSFPSFCFPLFRDPPEQNLS